MRVLLIALLAVESLTAQSVLELRATDTFHGAYSQENEIRFDPFQKLNWDEKAREALPGWNFDRPTSAQIATMRSFESAGPQYRVAEFLAPADPLVQRAPYLLISASGVTPVQPVQLMGTVDLWFDEKLTAVKEKFISGSVVGKTARPVDKAAFVVMGKPSDVSEIRPAARFVERKSVGYQLTYRGRVVRAVMSEPYPSEIKSALSFRLSGKLLLLVRWNDGGCETNFTLFTVGSVLTPIAGNSYDCDP